MGTFGNVAAETHNAPMTIGIRDKLNAGIALAK
jgi:hypothetical protein